MPCTYACTIAFAFFKVDLRRIPYSDDGWTVPAFFLLPPPSIPHPNSPLNPQQSVRSWATLPSPISPDIISLHCELDLGQTPLSFLFLSPCYNNFRSTAPLLLPPPPPR